MALPGENDAKVGEGGLVEIFLVMGGSGETTLRRTSESELHNFRLPLKFCSMVKYIMIYVVNHTHNKSFYRKHLLEAGGSSVMVFAFYVRSLGFIHGIAKAFSQGPPSNWQNQGYNN